MTPVRFTRFCSDVLRVQLTLPQLVFAKVAFDRVQPKDLRGQERAIASELFGDIEAEIPPHAWLVLAWLKGARVGGSWMCGLYLLYRMVTADLSGLAAGEQAFAPVVAPDMATGRQPKRFALGAARATPELARLIESETADGFVIRRPDGQCVSLEVRSASRGGASARGRTMVAALMDESSFFRDPDSGVVNDSEIFRALAPRIIPGGTLCLISTAWAEIGLLWDLVQKNHGHPLSALAAITPTLTMRPDSDQLRQVVEDETERDRENADREFNCVPFVAGSTHFFDPRAITLSIDEDAPLVLEPTELSRYGNDEAAGALGLDTAWRKDPCAAVATRCDGKFYRVAETIEVRPPPGGRLVPSETIAGILARARYHRLRTIAFDQHYSETVRECASGFSLKEAPGGLVGKVDTFSVCRRIMNEGLLKIPAGNKRLISQLRAVVSKPTSGGSLSISSPRRAGAHGDLVSALVLSVWALERTEGERADTGPLVIFGIPSRMGGGGVREIRRGLYRSGGGGYEH